MKTRWWLICLLLVLLTPPTSAGQRFRPLDSTAPDPSCNVVIASPDGSEVVVPCGADVTAEQREYDAWIETTEAITPFRVSVDARRDRLYELPLVRAGLVSVEPLTPDGSVDLWHMEAHELNETRQPSFYRVVRRASEVKMPEGRMVAIFRDRNGEPISVSSPVRVTAGRTTAVAGGRSGDDSTLVIILERPSGAPQGTSEVLAIDHAGRERPDLALTTANHMVALWYSLPPGRVRVSLQSDALMLDSVAATLSRERDVVVHTRARRLPSLEVLVSAPADHLRKAEMTLSVSQHDVGTVATETLPESGSIRIENLPAANLEVVLMIDGWRFPRHVDLSSGVDGLVTFDLSPLTVSGVVRYAGDPADAEVGFRAARLITARTDERGRYSIRLWGEGRYPIVVTLPQLKEVPPFHDMVRIDQSRTLDFDFAAACHSVRVVDRGSGRPIPAAKVTYANAFDDPYEKGRRVMSSVTADDDGVARLPPLRQGSLHLWIEAQGYNLREDEVRVQRECDGDAIIQVALEPRSDDVVVHLVLPNGAAAAHAELLAVTAEDTLVFTASAGEDGTVRVPLGARGALLVARHSAAGSSVRILESSEDQEVRWQLPPPGPPLRVLAEEAGGRPGRNVSMFVWIDGVRLGGNALAFACRAAPFTRLDGEWVGLNLPAAATRLLAVKSSGGVLPSVDAFEAMAVTVPYPWPSSMKVVVH